MSISTYATSIPKSAKKKECPEEKLLREIREFKAYLEDHLAQKEDGQK